MTKVKIVFQLKFWSGAALLLFIYGISYGHWQIALVRNIYFPIIGFLLSSAAIALNIPLQIKGEFKSILRVGFFCGASAILTAAILNPITFALLGHEVSALPIEYISTDTLYFALFYLVWTLLYFRSKDSSPTRQSGPQADHITVESRGEMRTLQVSEIECVLSNGDYIELSTGDKSYLKKETLTNFEKVLPVDQFKRVHRTAIVNTRKVRAVRAKGRGVYEITMDSGRIVPSSRSYKSVIDDILPPG